MLILFTLLSFVISNLNILRNLNEYGCHPSTKGYMNPPSCDICSPKYDQLNCNKCLSPNYVPHAFGIRFGCVSNTCPNTFCNNKNSIGVPLKSNNCKCVCKGMWKGDCSICPSNYNQTTCTSCNKNTVQNYPYCYKKCTSINGNACLNGGVIKGDVFNGCHCQCKNKWSGSLCQICPFPNMGVNC